MTDLAERLGLTHPIAKAGMGGGLAGAALAGAVSAAGALGTVGIMPPRQYREELHRAREIAGAAPVAANLLVPFAKRSHVEACLEARAAAVVLHGGFDRELVGRLTEGGAFVLHTVGTREEATRALHEGAQGLIAQGVEAGGHLVGVYSALETLGEVRQVAGTAPVLLAGGIADDGDVRRALDAGADAVVAGTRFLLTAECPAHPAYKQRVLSADSTLETLLFGLGWPMRHRVVPNAATQRWCAKDRFGPTAVRMLEARTTALSRLPMAVVMRAVSTQHPAIPLYGPAAPLAGMPDRLVEATALYAGETALRINAVVPAREAVHILTAGLSSGRPGEQG